MEVNYNEHCVDCQKNETKSKEEILLTESLAKLGLKYTAENLEKCLPDLKILSSRLPQISDTSLFEIDDILYDGDDDEGISQTHEAGKLSEELTSFVIRECFRHFLVYSRRVKHQIVDNTFCQLIGKVGIEHLELISFADFARLIETLVVRRTEINICRAIKFLKVAMADHSRQEVLENTLYEYPFLLPIFFWISNLRNIPEAKIPKQKRITTWLSHQCTVIFERFKFKGKELKVVKTLKFLKQLGEVSEFNKNYLKLLILIGENGFRLYPDYLFKYFSTARSVKEKLQLSKRFLTANWTMVHESCSYIKNVGIQSSLLMVDIFEVILTIKYSNDEMRVIDICHCNDMEPYISVDDYQAGNQFLIDNPKIDQNQDSIHSKNRQDYTIERFMIYDDFLKYLFVKSRMYKAFSWSKKLIKVTGDFDEVDRYFYSKSLKRFFLDVILGKEKSDVLPWWFETTRRKCPYVLLSKRHEYMLDDLAKLLKGEHIGNVKLERLYRAVCGMEALHIKF